MLIAKVIFSVLAVLLLAGFFVAFLDENVPLDDEDEEE